MLFFWGIIVVFWLGDDFCCGWKMSVVVVVGWCVIVLYKVFFLYYCFVLSYFYTYNKNNNTKNKIKNRFLGEELFLDRRFHLMLLVGHLAVLSLFLYLYCIR